MRTLLLYNPAAGTQRGRRLALVEAAATHLRSNGFDVVVTPTTAQGSAAKQVIGAVAEGCRAVIACGGDGTIHDVLQGVAETEVSLGILPFGSANALARELRLPRDPVQAAQLYRPALTMPVRLGVVTRPDHQDRYFLSMAGAGPDGALMYRMLTASRSRLGHWLYYWHALRLFLRNDFPQFTVTVRSTPDTPWRQHRCVSAMALRIGALGGLFSGLARGASLQDASLRVLLVHPPAALGLPLWFLSSWLGLTGHNPLLTAANVQSLAITPGPSFPHIQADGEWLGSGPCELSFVPREINVFRPAVGPN